MTYQRVANIPAMNLDDFTNNESQKIWKGSYTFVCAADPQFGMVGAFSHGKNEPTWDEEIRLSKLAIKQINHMHPRPKFFVICGDLLDALPFATPPKYYRLSKFKDIDLHDFQYQDFVKVYRDLNPEIKLVIVSGNHDVGDNPTKETVRLYREEHFGSDFYTFWVGGVKYVVLNSQFFVAPDHVKEEAMEHWKFFTEVIKDPEAKHIVVFQHIPPFKFDQNEEDNYSILPKSIRFKVLDLFNDAGVKVVFCGHCHANCEGKYKNVEIITTTALGAPMGDDPVGYRIVKVTASSITHTFHPVEPRREPGSKPACKRCMSKCTITYILMLFWVFLTHKKLNSLLLLHASSCMTRIIKEKKNFFDVRIQDLVS